VVGLASPLLGNENKAAEAWVAAKAEAVNRLGETARRAHGLKLYKARDETYERLLSLDPDHAEARKRLKYVRRDGAWVRKHYTRPKDRGPREARVQEDEAFGIWLASWRQQLVEIHASAWKAEDPGTKKAVFEVALAWFPDDPEIRKLGGEVRHGQGAETRWILGDTHRALANRARFLKEAREATRSVPAGKPGHLETTDRADRFPWPTVLQGRTVRVLGAVSAEEVALHLRVADSAAEVFLSVFGRPGHLPTSTERYSRGFPLYIASSPLAGNQFLAAEPGIEERDMEFLRPLIAAYFPKRVGVLVKTEPSTLRLEATSRMVQHYAQARHLAQDRTTKGAWAMEAVSLYLGWLQVRTRQSYTVKDAHGGRYNTPRPGVPSWKTRMADQRADWHSLAAEAMATLSTPDLHLMAGKDVNKLVTREMLAGYGIAVFIMEAHPELSVPFFQDVGAQKQVDLDAVLRKHLHKDLATLRPHLLRWLREMGELSPPPGEWR